MMKQILLCMMVTGLLWAPGSRPVAAAEGVYVVKPIVEKKIKQLPPGPLFWRVESFPTLAQAQATIQPDRWNPDTVSYDVATALAAEAAGKAWLFTLGPKGGSTPELQLESDEYPEPECPPLTWTRGHRRQPRARA